MKRIFKKIIASLIAAAIVVSSFCTTMSFSAVALDTPIFKLTKVSETDTEVKISISLYSGKFRYATFIASYGEKISACTGISKGTVLSNYVINEENVIAVSNPSTCYATIISVPTLNTLGEYYIFTFSKAVTDTITDADISIVEDEVNSPIMELAYVPCDISIDESEVTLCYGETTELSTTLNPATGETPIWTSADESIATVVDGLVTAVDYGETTITAYTKSGTYATCTVKVDTKVKEDASVEVETEDDFIFGADVLGSTDEEIKELFEDTNVTVNSSTEKIATGDTIVFTKENGEVYKTITVVVFGDVNCDGVYDGLDVTILNCIVGNMLTRQQVGEAVYAAADCNHDGNVDELDSILLNDAGLLLSEVGQSTTK